MQLKVYEITWGETQTATGSVAGNVVSYNIAFSDQGPVGPSGSQGIQGPQGLPGDFVVNFRVVSAAETLVSKAKIAADTTAGAFTLTLPANPTNGDVIDFYDYAETFDVNPLTIARNGSRIESVEENLICNVKGAYFSMVYSGSTRGWQVLPSFGTAGGGGESVLTIAGDLLYRGSVVDERLPIGSQGQILKVNNGLPVWSNETGLVTSVAGKIGTVTLEKSDVGLANVDNTSDVNKPVSTAVQSALDGKAAAAHNHVAADITDFAAAVAAVSPPVDWDSLADKPSTFTPSSHTHVAADITDFTSAVEAVSPPADWDTLANKPASFTPSAHSSTHHTGGADALAAHQINGQTIFGTGTPTYSADQTLAAARALQLTVSNTNASGINLTLPVQSDGTLNGDTYVVIGGGTVSGPITIRRINVLSPLIYQTLATITATGQQYRFRATGATTGGWTLVPVDSHTHPSTQITGLGTAATQDSTAFAPASGIDPTAISGTAVVDNDARLSDSRTPTAHKNSHSIGQADFLAPIDIGAQSLFETIAVLATTDTTLTASRAAKYNIANTSGTATNITLPTSGVQDGDIALINATLLTLNSSLIIRRFNSAGGGTHTTLATITKTIGNGGELHRFVYQGSWALDVVTNHGSRHSASGGDPLSLAASQITSGTLAHERGGLEADVSAYNGLLKIASGSTSAVTVTSAGEALLDDADAAAQRTTLGLGTAATSASTDFAAASHTHPSAEITGLATVATTGDYDDLTDKPTGNFLWIIEGTSGLFNTGNGIEYIVPYNLVTVNTAPDIFQPSSESNLIITPKAAGEWYRFEARYTTYDITDPNNFLLLRLRSSPGAFGNTGGTVGGTVRHRLFQGHTHTGTSGEASGWGSCTVRVDAPTYFAVTFLHSSAPSTGYPVFDNGMGLQPYLYVRRLGL